MINVRKQTCSYDECNIQASFNYFGQKKWLYCFDHKLENMVDVKSRKCIFPKCMVIPSFNYDGQKKGLYCFDHKLENMLDVLSDKCIYLNCNIIASFNFWGQKKGIYCYDHREANMENVVTRKCLDLNCKKQPVFNYPGLNNGIYCKKHKKKTMENVKHKKCGYPKCKTQPKYNFPGKCGGIFCDIHKENLMIDVITKRCAHNECDKSPAFNYSGKKRLYCFTHKLVGMEDVITPRCKLCPTICNNKYKGYCYRCFIYQFPDNQIVKNYKTKERAVADFIRQSYSNYDIILDKRIINGCSQRRPDIFIDMGDFTIVIEIDENQHQVYDCSCDNKRLMQIFQDAGSRPMAMIRFNPDQYISSNGKRISSCWGYTKDKGLCIIKNKKDWNNRLTGLKNAMEDILHNRIDRKDIEVVHLYYDGEL